MTTDTATEPTNAFADAFSAGCVCMRVSCFSAAKTRTSKLATDAARAATGALQGRYAGAVMPDSLIKPLRAKGQQARRYLEKNSVEFGEYRMVLLSDYATVRAGLADLAREYMEIVEEETEDWESFRDIVKDASEGLWTDELLPELRTDYLAEFEMQVSVAPMPEKPKAIALPADLAMEVQADIEREISARYEEVVAAQFNDLGIALDAIIDRVQAGSKTTAATFNGIRDTAERLAKFNLSGNARLRQLTDATLRVIDQIDVGACNSSEQYRAVLSGHFGTLRSHVA